MSSHSTHEPIDLVPPERPRRALALLRESTKASRMRPTKGRRVPTEEVTNPHSPPMQRSGTRPFPARNSIAAFVWLAVLVPFVVTVLANGPSGGLIPHGIYHLVYVVIVCAAIYVLLQWRSRTTSRIAQRLMLFTAALQGFAVVGHIGEWASTLSDEQYNEPGVGLVKGNEALHTTFANVTVPALVLSILFVIATTVVASRARRDR